MGVIGLYIGQAGSKIGERFYSEVHSDIKVELKKTGVTKLVNQEYVKKATNKWFFLDKKGKIQPRAVFVDTHSKVLSHQRSYKARNSIRMPLNGCGNNWAMGYFYKSKFLLQDVMNCVRKEAEECDNLEHFFGILSTAGGTGSGVGSKILQAIKEEFPKKDVVNTLILPYRDGEIATQSYNTLLTFSKVYEFCNISIVYENDAMHRICKNQLGLKETTFDDINYALTNQLLGLFQPTKHSILQPLMAHAKYPLIQTSSAPLVSRTNSKFELEDTWSTISNTLSSNLKTNCTTLYDVRYGSVTIQPQCVGNVLVTRGGQVPNAKELKALKDSNLYVKWLPEDYRLTNYHHPRRLGQISTTSTLAFNSNKVCEVISSFLGDAWTLFGSKSYLHHYNKYGVNEDYFLESFETVKTLLDDYRTM